MNKKIIFTFVSLTIVAGLMSAIVLSSHFQNSRVNVSESNNNNITDNSVLTPSSDRQDLNNDQQDLDAIYYYTQVCPFCEDVAAWMNENDVDNKLNIPRRDVGQSEALSQELTKKAAECGLEPNQIGVPFLYAEEQCFIGAPDIINYLESEINNSNDQTEKEKGGEEVDITEELNSEDTTDNSEVLDESIDQVLEADPEID